MGSMQKQQGSGKDADRSGDDLPGQLFVQEQNPEDDDQSDTQLVNRRDLGHIPGLQRLEIEKP